MALFATFLVGAVPAGAALSPGDIIYAEFAPRRLIGIRPDGTPSGFEVQAPTLIEDLATGRDGSIYITTRGFSAAVPDRIHRVNPVTGALTTVYTLSPTGNRYGLLRGLGVEPGGTLAVSTWDDGILRIDPRTGLRTTITPPTVAEPWLTDDVEVGPDGSIYVDRGSGLPPIYRVDPVTGEVRPASTGERLTAHFRFGVAPDGMIFATSYPPGQGVPVTDQWHLVRVNPATLEETVLYRTTNPDAYLADAAVDAAGNVYVAEMGFPNDNRVDGVVSRFHPVTGARSVVYSGPSVLSPFLVAV